jgi:outer membrane lipoprotein-sorting protein
MSKQMKKITLITIIYLLSLGTISAQSADQIIEKVDANMSSKNRIIESEMIIHGKRNSRTITSLSYSVGDKKSFTEYLSPAREQGTKMLKLEDKLWIYSPSTDRIIQISGHMLRQSLMGSDLSYEDMMDDRKLTETYTSTIVGQEIFEGRDCFILELKAKVEDVAYDSRKIWIDAERYVPLKEDLFAKSGQLLKRTALSNVKKIQGRWFPTAMVYKDMLKQGDGTEFIIKSLKFDQEIEEYIFTKAALKQ